MLNNRTSNKSVNQCVYSMESFSDVTLNQDGRRFALNDLRMAKRRPFWFRDDAPPRSSH